MSVDLPLQMVQMCQPVTLCLPGPCPFPLPSAQRADCLGLCSLLMTGLKLVGLTLQNNQRGGEDVISSAGLLAWSDPILTCHYVL